MLKVLDEKLLSDFRAIEEKRKAAREGIAVATRTFAQNLGYDEEHAAALVAFVQENNAPDGLTDAERAKMEILAEYVVEIADDVSPLVNVVTEA